MMPSLNISENYLCLEDVKTICIDKQECDISIVHINAVSLVANFDNIACFLENINFPDVICISETRLKNEKINWQSNLVSLPNYNMQYDNSLTCAGGVAIYVKDHFVTKVNSDSKLNVEDCESLFIELTLSLRTNLSKNIPLLIGCVYRHPRPTTSLFVDVFCEKLSKYVDKNLPFIILGDFNIDACKATNSEVKYYINMLSSIGCKNFINVHTRISGNSRSTLDHIIIKH